MNESFEFSQYFPEDDESSEDELNKTQDPVIEEELELPSMFARYRVISYLLSTVDVSQPVT